MSNTLANEDYEYFVSYNQTLSDDFAQRIYDAFNKQRGYKVYVNHILQKKRTGRFRKEIDRIIGNCKVFILVNSYNTLNRNEVIREVNVAFPEGKMQRELWILRENNEDVPKITDKFKKNVSLDISEFEQNEFNTLGELARQVLRLCDGRKNQIQPKETSIPSPPVFQFAKGVSTSATSAQINLQDLQEKAKNFFIKKDYENTLELYEQILVHSPLDIVTLDATGTTLGLMKRYSEAETYFSLAISLNPRIAELWNNKALTLYPQKRYQESLICINKALTLSPNNITFINNKALIYYEKEDYNDSLKYYDEALSLSKTNVSALIGKSAVLYKMNKKNESFDISRLVVTIDPHNDHALYNLGVSYFERQEILKALECFDNSLEINPNNFPSLIYKGTILRQLSRYNEALKIYEKMIELEPSNYLVYYNKGVALGFMGKHEEAEILYKKALELNPNYVNAIINISESLRLRALYDEALLEIEKALKIEEDNIRSLGIKARILIQKERYGEAESTLRQALKITKRQDLLILLIATISNQGRHNETISLCNKELKLDPKNVGILLERGAAYVRTEKFKLAERDFDKVISIAPDDPYANYNKAAILLRQSKVKKALPLIKKAIKFDSDLAKIIKEDPAFEKIRTNVGFIKIISQSKNSEVE